jgi:hypothetical protein
LLIAIATMILFTAVTDGVARWLFPDSASGQKNCLISDPRTGVRGMPDSACQEKVYESPLIDYRFNDCGFRTPQPCQPAAGEIFRIVLIGSSFNYGMNVQQPESFAARMGPMLSAQVRHPVDIFNEAMFEGFPATWALRTKSMIQPRPSLILWPLTPMDIQHTLVLQRPIAEIRAEEAIPPAGARRMPWAWQRFIRRLSETRLVLMLQHYLFYSQSQSLSHTLAQDHKIDYLRAPPPPSLQANLADFARNFHQVAAHARAANVPLVVTLLPTRTAAIMLSNHISDKGYDPTQLGRLIRRIVENEGVRYIDLMPGVASTPDAGVHYFPVDEHPDSAGHLMLATLMANALVRSGAITATGSSRP